MSSKQQNPPAPAADHGLRLFWWAMGAALLGLLVMYESVDTTPVRLAGPVAAASASAATPAAPAPKPAAARPTGPALARSRPVRLRIPQLAVDAPFVELGLTPAGALEVPATADRNLVGWYRGGPAPGQRGSAVVAGHVDTAKGPAVFLLLYLLTPGGTVEITRADGTVATFTVDAVRSYPKNAFPDREVYGDTPDAQLRLITCGGAYDRKAKDYTENVVAFAHLTASRRA